MFCPVPNHRRTWDEQDPIFVSLVVVAIMCSTQNHFRSILLRVYIKEVKVWDLFEALHLSLSPKSYYATTVYGSYCSNIELGCLVYSMSLLRVCKVRHSLRSATGDSSSGYIHVHKMTKKFRLWAPKSPTSIFLSSNSDDTVCTAAGYWKSFPKRRCCFKR
jgi:hypothetical protein